MKKYVLLLYIIAGLSIAEQAQSASYRWYKCDYLKATPEICEPRCITRSFYTGGNAFQREPNPINPAKLNLLRSECNAICENQNFFNCSFSESSNCADAIGPAELDTDVERVFADINNVMLAPALRGDIKRILIPDVQEQCEQLFMVGPPVPEPDEIPVPMPDGNNNLDINNMRRSASSLNLVGSKSIPELIGSGLKILMGITGSIALAIVIYAGILWMTAAGNSQREKQAMDILTWGALGLIVILSSYAIVQFIFTSVL